jgi:hypothetical protein
MNESEAAYNLDDTIDGEEPADFTEALFDERNAGYRCVLCTQSNATADGTGMRQQMDRIDHDLCGKVEDSAIFELQAEYYHEHIYKPLQRHEPEREVPRITADDCRRHYIYHCVNPRRMLKNDIHFINNAQQFLQKNGVLNKNRRDGKLKMNMQFLKQWNILSRNKLDLLRYYRQEFLREEAIEGSKAGPAEFSSF